MVFMMAHEEINYQNKIIMDRKHQLHCVFPCLTATIIETQL